jgi:hypothetical protein
VPGSARVAELTRLDEALAEIEAAGGPAVVLASGDPGFFGIVRALRARGILAGGRRTKIRFVTHYHIDGAAVAAAVGHVGEVLSACGRG